jgi:hypothetical protein
MATISPYDPTPWVNDSAPAINASNLNKIENQIDEITDAVIAIEDETTVPPTKLQYATPSVRGVVRLELVDNGDGTHTCNIWTQD